MVLIREGVVSIGESWFDDELETLPHVDVLYCIERSNPIDGIPFEEFYTIIIDLTKDYSELWQKLRKTDKYKINRASQKDEVRYEFWNQNIPAEVLNDFFEFYNKFALTQGLNKLRKDQFLNYAKYNVLDISCTKSKQGKILVWHSYYCDHKRARLLHSASVRNDLDRDAQSMISRANRYHHWQDITRFKEAGIPVYDFGGWYAGKTDQKKLGINDFKEGFGGSIIKNFNSSYGLTLKGKMYLNLKALIRSNILKYA